MTYDMYPIYYWSALGSTIPLVFIGIGFFFLNDDEDLSDAAHGEHEAETVALAGGTQAAWKFKGFLAPLALGALMFGLVGIGCTKRLLDPRDTLVYSAGLGLTLTLVLYYFAWAASESPTERPIPIRACVGKTGEVASAIPAGGTGRVMVDFGSRQQAFTARANEPIAAGVTVLVVALASDSILEVTPTRFSTPSWNRS